MNTDREMNPDMPSTDTPVRRVHFRLEHDADGYPPVVGETLWASPVGGDLYRVENVPFFAKLVSFGDVVATELIDDLPTFVRVETRGGHSTMRVVVFDVANVAGLRSALTGLGASTEGSHLPRLISVDIPPEAGLSKIRDFLRSGVADGQWDVEEADVPAGLNPGE